MERATPSLDELVERLIHDADDAAVLHVLGHVLPEGDTTIRIRRALMRRDHPVPAAVRDLGASVVQEALLMQDRWGTSG